MLSDFNFETRFGIISSFSVSLTAICKELNIRISLLLEILRPSSGLFFGGGVNPKMLPILRISIVDNIKSQGSAGLFSV